RYRTGRTWREPHGHIRGLSCRDRHRQRWRHNVEPRVAAGDRAHTQRSGAAVRDRELQVLTLAGNHAAEIERRYVEASGWRLVIEAVSAQRDIGGGQAWIVAREPKRALLRSGRGRYPSHRDRALLPGCDNEVRRGEQSKWSGGNLSAQGQRTRA